LTNGIIVLFLELQPSPNDALLERDRPILDQKRGDLLDLLLLLTGVFESVLKIVWFREVRVDRLRWLNKQTVELRSTPLELKSARTLDLKTCGADLNAVLYCVWEILDSA
jgi:hypothetical protein